MALDPAAAVAFAATRHRSVLATRRGNGTAQLSNVTHAVLDGVVLISIAADRVKYRNLVRDPWAALHVTSDDFWTWVVLEGGVEVSEPAAAPDDAVVEELVAYYRAAGGEHPDWDEYRTAMVNDRRAVVRIRPTYAYGQLPSAPPG